MQVKTWNVKISPVTNKATAKTYYGSTHRQVSCCHLFAVGETSFSLNCHLLEELPTLHYLPSIAETTENFSIKRTVFPSNENVVEIKFVENKQRKYFIIISETTV
jgi:hypothetical protein